MGSEYPDKVKSSRNQLNLSSRVIKESSKIIGRRLSRHLKLLAGELRGRRSFRDKGQLEVVDIIRTGKPRLTS
jgi:hypothetical protein